MRKATVYLNQEAVGELTESVSYTHLDVYKRQDLITGGSGNLRL